MPKQSDYDRFFWSDSLYDPRGTLIPAETGTFFKRMVNHAAHDYLKQARTELMTTMLQNARKRCWEERSWNAFQRLWNIRDEGDADCAALPELDETYWTHKSTAADDSNAPITVHSIDVDDVFDEDLMEIEHEDGDLSEDSEHSKEEQTDISGAAETTVSTAVMTEGECRQEILALVVSVRQRVQRSDFEDEDERHKVLNDLADIERQHELG